MTPTPGTAPVVSIEGLRLRRGGRDVLAVPRMVVGRGETWVVVGPNGAGKTSLLRALALLDAPAEGRLGVFGHELHERPSLALRRRIVLAFQETLLLDDTVLANVALPLRLRGIGRAESEAAARVALELFGAAHLAARRARRLSGGEGRRVALARAFAPRPELLLLDEPFAALDAPSREALARDLKRAIRETGTTCVAVSHDRTEALLLSDHVGVVLGGKLVQAGPTDLVFRAPASEDVARFMGVENLVQVRVVSRSADTFKLDAAGQPLTCAPSPLAGDTALACIRAEDVLLATGEPGSLSARNAIRCTVEGFEPAAAGVRVRLNGPFPLVALLTRAAVDELALEPGRPVVALFKSSAVHLA